MKTKHRVYLRNSLILVVSLLIISLLISLLTSTSYVEALRIVFGSIYVLFLPGFIISFIFFPKTRAFEDKEKDKEKGEKGEKGAIDWIERIALSFALSIAIVPLVVFYLNLIGIKINLLNSFLTILGIIIISFIILFIKKEKRSNYSYN